MTVPASALKTLLRRYWAIIAIVVAWQVWVDVSGLNSIVMPRPLSVLGDIIAHVDVYLASGGLTVAVAFVGMLAGLTFGTGLALLAWYSPVLGGTLTPLSLIFSSIPVVTVIPILARLFGYDLRTVVVIVGIISFFPAFVFTSAGLKAVPAGSSDLLSVLGASKWKRLWLLAVPAAVPNWMIALRIAAPGAILAAMLAEFLMGTSGLGYQFVIAKAAFDMDRALGASLLAMLVSLLSFSIAAIAERRVRARWR